MVSSVPSQRSDSCFYATYRAFINCFSSSSSSMGVPGEPRGPCPTTIGQYYSQVLGCLYAQYPRFNLTYGLPQWRVLP